MTDTLPRATPADLEAVWQRLLALRWQSMDSAPEEGRVLFWCADIRREWPDYTPKPMGAVMGKMFDGHASGGGMTGDWTFTAWMPLPPIKD